jgi:PAS domain-containing protein
MDDAGRVHREDEAAAPSQDPRQQELAEIASALRAELAMAAAGIGTFDWDLVTGVLDWDERLVEMFGYGDEEAFDRSIESFNARLHPHDLGPVTQALQGAIDDCGEYSALYRICLPGDVTRWVSARGRVLCDPEGTPVRLLGAAYDITDQRGDELGVVRVLESMPAGFYSLDAEWRFTYVNAQAETLLGRSKEELLGQVLWDSFPAAVASEFEENYRRAVATGAPPHCVARGDLRPLAAFPSPTTVSFR